MFFSPKTLFLKCLGFVIFVLAQYFKIKEKVVNATHMA